MLNNQEIKTPVLIEDLGMHFATDNSKTKQRYGLYKCHCGAEFKTKISNIKSGNTSSCGCYNKKLLKIANTTHGMRKHKIYTSWDGIIQRTTNKNNKHFNYYGGRGIEVCERWANSFENFMDDMLPTWENGLSIDRIDPNGNYEPSNCRWVTKTMQSINTRLIRANNISGYRGVSFDKKRNKWASCIRINGITNHLGRFIDKIDAAKAYDNFVITNNLPYPINGVLPN